MFLAIRDGEIVERSTDEKSLLGLDPGQHEIVEWNEPLPPPDPDTGFRPDPRDSSQKDKDILNRYRRRRLRAYPSIRKQLDMLYRDTINGTTTWVDEITRIKELFPKPPGA